MADVDKGQVTRKGEIGMKLAYTSNLLDGCGATGLTEPRAGQRKPGCGWPASTFAVSLEPAASSKQRWKNETPRSGLLLHRARHTVTWPRWLACRISGSPRSSARNSLGILFALVFAGTAAAAAGQPTAWTKPNMVTAIKALGYPKPHAKKLACRGLGPAQAGAHTAFRCTSTYKHHRRRVFVIGGDGQGGWLCAGKTIAGCNLMRRGFATNGQIATLGSIAAEADLASRGYMSNHYGSYQPTGFCKQQTASTWACGFTTATVTLKITHAKGGYIVAGSATPA